MGGEGNDLIIGDANSDTIRGGAGNDTIYGGAGTDIIYVNDGGSDVVYGGSDRDTFVIDFNGQLPTQHNNTVIKDFNQSASYHDKIELKNVPFSGL